MDNKNLWIISTKSMPLENSMADVDGSDYYYSDCILISHDSASAEKSIPHLLRDHDMELLEVIGCVPYVEDDWSESDQYQDIKDAVEQVKQTGTPSFALFISSQAMDFEDEENNEVEWVFGKKEEGK
ncbi:hypothetical protein [Marinibactrum halimedae]|nr:hypothetical protein [Marinibactrum halimedae]MCD9458603.1 hypothetical protein [Marinibactrum halimedae]